MLFFACSESQVPNSDLSSSVPLLVSANPNPAFAHSTLIIQGYGFSPNLNENLLSFDSYLIPSNRYSILNETEGSREQIEFLLPDTLAAATYSLYVLVRNQVSNSLSVVIEP